MTAGRTHTRVPAAATGSTFSEHQWPQPMHFQSAHVTQITARKADIMIEVQNLSKRYGDKLAVDDVSFVVQPGMVTGFLGPERCREVHHHADDRGT